MENICWKCKKRFSDIIQSIRNMIVDDYKNLFEIKHEEGWLDNNILFAKCKICGKLIFDRYLIKNWYTLDDDQRKKKFYTTIRRHINTYHSESIPHKRTKLMEQDMYGIIDMLLTSISDTNK